MSKPEKNHSDGVLVPVQSKQDKTLVLYSSYRTGMMVQFVWAGGGGGALRRWPGYFIRPN